MAYRKQAILFVSAAWRQAAALLLAGTLALMTACGGGDAGTQTAGSGAGSSSGGTGGSTGGTSTGNSGLYTLAVDKSPLTATATTDDGRAATRDFGVEGGRLSAIGADGTVYELTVPPDALDSKTRIRMTPLVTAQITDLPAERIYGVKFEPEGLQFFKPATLAIKLPSSVSLPIEGQIPVGWSGPSNTVSLALIDPTSREPRLKLMHFSTYAMMFHSKGMTASIEPVRQRLGGSAEDRIRSAAAERLAKERAKALLGNADDASIAGFDDLRTQFVAEVLLPRLAAAGSSCAAGKLAWQTLLGYERENSLLGMVANDPRYPKPFSTMMMETLEQMSLVCMREEYELCRDSHVLTRILPAYLSLERMAQLAEGNPKEAQSMRSWLPQAEDRVRQCLKFELQFDSSVTHSSAGLPKHSMSETVSARVPIGYRMKFNEPLPGAPQPIVDTGALISGDPATLASRAYSVSLQEDCSQLVRASPADGTLAVGMLGFVTDGDPWSPRPRVADYGISLAASPNRSDFSYTLGTRNGAGCENVQSLSDMTNWSTEAFALIADRFASASSGLYIDGWQVYNGMDILATKEFTLRGGSGGDDTSTTVKMILFHTPER
jgi:hypothetical protein